MNEYEKLDLQLNNDSPNMEDRNPQSGDNAHSSAVVFHSSERRYDYRPIALYDTSKMTHNEWLAMRQTQCRIGGSEASVVQDKSPWTCSKELFDKKQGISPKIKTEFNETNKKIGTLLEPIVQQFFVMWFEKNYNHRLTICSTIEEFNNCSYGIYNDKHFYQCGRKDASGNLLYPFITGNVDGLIKINNRIGVLEYKTTTTHGSQKKTVQNWRKGIPPAYYESQVRQYMGCLNLEYAFLVCLWGLSLEDMKAIYIERDYDIEDQLFESERLFYEKAASGQSWDDSTCKAELLANYYTRLYGEVDPEKKPVQLSSAYFPVMEKMLERTKRRKELELILEEMDQEDNKLIALLSPVIENASRCYCKDKSGKTIFVRITTPHSKHIYPNIKGNKCVTDIMDIQALKAEHPDLYEKYQETVFDVRTFRTEHPRTFAKYEYPAAPTGSTNSYKAELL